MLQEECKEKILSEEYRDFMMRDTGALGKNFPLENGCRIPLKYGFELFYIDQSEDRKKSLADYPYTMVPKCYTTLDMAAIQQAGIAAVQNIHIIELSIKKKKIIKNLKQQGYTIICITNLADEILLADRTLVLEQGKIALEIKREELVEKAEELRKYEIKLPTILEILVELQKNGIQVNAKDYTIPELVNYLVTAKAGGSK